MKMAARFTDEAPTVVCVETVVGDDCIAQKAEVSLDDFIEAMAGSVRVAEDRSFRIGRLPFGYLDGSVDTVRDKTFKVATLIPAGRHQLRYDERVFFLPYPTLLFLTSVVKGQLSASYVVALDDADPLQANVCEFPYGNVYGDTHICWGDCKLGEFDSFADVDRLHACFFGSKANADLWERPEGWEGKTFLSFLEYLSGQDDYPAELLIKVGGKVVAGKLDSFLA